MPESMQDRMPTQDPAEDGAFFSTGNHPVETLLPLHHMAQAGYGIDVATISGGPGKFEW